MTDDPTRSHNVPRNREERTTGITSCQAIRPENHVATKITMYERADRDMQMKTVTGRTNHTGISRDLNRQERQKEEEEEEEREEKKEEEEE